MGTPREYFHGRNQDAMGIIVDALNSRGPHLDDLDFAGTIISDLYSSGMIVVDQVEYDKAKALADAVRGLVQS
jgi:hypothetical protein